MNSPRVSPHLVLFLCVSILAHSSHGARIPLTATVTDNTLTFSYHDGPLLTGHVPVTLIWYGNFTPSHRAIVSDFVTSLSLPPPAGGQPSVAMWWRTLETYYSRSKTPLPTLTPGAHILDESCSLGKSLSATDIARLAAKHRSKKRGIAVVLTADDVAVEGFCMSRCGSHGADERTKSAYIWVGNSAVQCPGQCAWPFHKPIYGPQVAALVAPNGDVGADGMVVNLASMVAGAVTNPFGGGFYQGPRAAPLEAATACAGVFGSAAYPGFAGKLLLDAASGASYNAVGARGRKYLLPALFDPATSSCSTLV